MHYILLYSYNMFFNMLNTDKSRSVLVHINQFIIFSLFVISFSFYHSCYLVQSISYRLMIHSYNLCYFSIRLSIHHKIAYYHIDSGYNIHNIIDEKLILFLWLIRLCPIHFISDVLLRFSIVISIFILAYSIH